MSNEDEAFEATNTNSELGSYIGPRVCSSHSLVLTAGLLSGSHDREDLAIVRSFGRDGLNLLYEAQLGRQRIC